MTHPPSLSTHQSGRRAGAGPRRLAPVGAWLCALPLIFGSGTGSSGGAMTAEGLDKLPGLNRMVWLRVPPAEKIPNIDGTLDLERGEWADAVCVAGFLVCRDWRSLQDAATNEKIWRIYSSITGWGDFDQSTSVYHDQASTARGRVHLRPGRSLDLGKVSVGIPANDTALVLVARQ